MTSNQIQTITILDSPDWNWDDEHIFVCPNIPRKKLLSAINSYAKGVSPPEVLVLLDDTFFGGAREGLLITNNAMYAKEKERVPKRIMFNEISSIQPDIGSRIMVDGENFFQADFIEHFTVSSFASQLSSILNFKSVQSQNDQITNDQYSKLSDTQSKTSGFQKINTSNNISGIAPEVIGNSTNYADNVILSAELGQGSVAEKNNYPHKVYYSEFNGSTFRLELPQFTERLKMMTSNTLDLLRQETTRLINLQISTLQEALPSDKNVTENPEFKTWISNLENERQKIEKLEMVLAVIGTMKAGKSTTINAIVGMEILPNRETAMTTLPTLIRNKHGQKQPILKIEKIQPLLELSKAIAQKLNGLNDVEKNQIDLQGIEDGKTLITQLIQQHGYPFKTEYNGQDAIFEFLRHLNDIMRLAKDKIIDIEPPYAAYENVDDLPVIEVEFCHLKDNQDVAQGSLAILDTPGPNEFGQSPALRKVFRTQLEKASAVLLVTDFTQMKTEADQNVRDQIADIEDQLPKGSLYVVVNKFDQRNKNSMTKEEVKDYVANSLMAGKVETAQVFPVSSYFAYLANRVKSYLEQHDTLPSHEQELWLGDFAEKAFGIGWEEEDEEEDIWDVDHVKDHIKKLEKKSLFDEPIEKVIKEAHADAANKSLESATKKLVYYNNELSNMLNLRSNTMTKDIREIEKMRKNLQKDIESCLEVSKKVKATAKSATSELGKKLEEVMNAQSKQINDVLDTFFKEGKAMEKTKQDEMLQENLQKRSSTWGSIFNFFGDTVRQERTERLFDPNSPRITFSGSSEAKDLIRKINSSIEDIFENADTTLDSITKNLIESTSQDISKLIDDTVRDVLDSAKKKLQDNGVELNFKLPAINLTIADVDTAELFDAYQEKTNTETRRRRSSGAWGTVCGWFKTSDWGYEEYDYKYTTYSVDIQAIRVKVLKQLAEQVKKLSSQTDEYLNKKFQPKIDEHLKQLVAYLERYRGVLDSAIESSKLDEAAKTALVKQLTGLLEKQAVLKGDIDAINISESITKQAD